MRRLEEGMFVAGQLAPADMPDLAARGIALIVNNRPDGEEPDQPTAAEIGEAAARAGLTYVQIPVARLTPDAVDAMRAALEQAGGPVVAFCKSGTRSTYLWALARSRQGVGGDALADKAAAAGYDLSPIRRFLR